ncbi:MAG: DinB family protein [Nocardioides sp.]
MPTKPRATPYAADERATLLAFLDHHRDVLRVKTEGLDAAQLDRRLAPSDLTLGGMLQHLAFVEDWWIGVTLLGEPPRAPFDDVDWEADDDWDWHSAAGQEPVALRSVFDRFVARSDEALSSADSLDMIAVRRHSHSGEGISLRWILVHLIEEYARHNGHADLLRESIDGSVGS